MAEITLPANAQHLLMQMQTFQQQYQTTAMQKESLSMQKIEIQKAVEELEKIKDDNDVYKAVGPILVKSTKSDLLKEMKEKKEVIDVKLKSLGAQEEMLRKRMGEAETKLKGMISKKGQESGGSAE